MSVAAIIGFISALLFGGSAIGFGITNKSDFGFLKQKPILFCSLGFILIFAAIMFELILLITKKDATWQVRLSALDLWVVTPLLVLSLLVIRIGKNVPKLSCQFSHIFLLMSWVFMIINIICNLVIFFSGKCIEALE